MNAADWPTYHYRATVTRIIDGDTIETSLDLGDRTYRRRRIRLLGYDAAEVVGASRAAGYAAHRALATLLPVGTQVYVRTKLDRTSFDRLLGYVWVAGDDGELVAVEDWMRDAGHDVSGIESRT